MGIVVCLSSVVRTMVLSRKLSKMDAHLLWNTIKMLTLLILLPRSDPSADAFVVSNNKGGQILIWLPI